jgi:8-oxo-dGTP diphosphatase
MSWIVGVVRWLIVVAAVIVNKSGILLAQRPLSKAHGGMWEFPGGKVEPTESQECALVRELKEELGITAVEMEFFKAVRHSYGSWGIDLIAYTVTQFRGTPRPIESQLQLKWVAISELHQYPFPRANRGIIDSLVSTTSDAFEPAIVLE